MSGKEKGRFQLLGALLGPYLGAVLGVLVALHTIENPGGLAGILQITGMFVYGFIGAIGGAIIVGAIVHIASNRKSPPKPPPPE